MRPVSQPSEVLETSIEKGNSKFAPGVTSKEVAKVITALLSLNSSRGDSDKDTSPW